MSGDTCSSRPAQQARRLVAASVLGWCVVSPFAFGALTPPAVPELEPGAGIIRDKAAAIALGKALFWDAGVGSDGIACASCHFSAGADSRIRNQISPGLLDAAFADAGGDIVFGSMRSDTGQVGEGEMPSGNPAGPNYELTPEDFPLHQLFDYKNRNSDIVTTTNDVVSSSGAYESDFHSAFFFGREQCSEARGTVFNANGFPARQVEPRNTPTTINAAFYYSNFWDGRANNLFNGVGVFGMRDVYGDPTKRLIVKNPNGSLSLDYLRIRNASLASQAVGPVLSALEMSCNGRTFPDVGRKLLTRIPLLGQKVSRQDSVLGPYANTSGTGLNTNYRYAALVRKAFEPKYWGAVDRFLITRTGDSQATLVRSSKGYTQIETNFSMFWGIAVMLYEQQLVSDRSRFDTWFASCRPTVTAPAGSTPISNPTVTCTQGSLNPTDPDHGGFTELEVLGFGLFNMGGGALRREGNPACGGCHGPIATPTQQAAGTILPILSEAAFAQGETTFLPVERSLLVDPNDPDRLPAGPPPRPADSVGGSHDRGFFNIGVTPSSVDPGNGGKDPYGNPLSMARMFLAEQAGLTVTDPSGIADRCAPTAPRPLVEPGGTPPYPGCGDQASVPFVLEKERELVDGSFKTPSLRNVALTPPYFHSGNYNDLRSVVEFYARGGSRRDMTVETGNAIVTGDTSGSGPKGKGPLPFEDGPDFGTNNNFFIRDVKSTEEQIDALVAFMLTLTDTRVQCDQAPFDHPELVIFDGHRGTDVNGDRKADDITHKLPAVGAAGYSPASGYCIPNSGDLFAPGMQARAGGEKVQLQ